MKTTTAIRVLVIILILFFLDRMPLEKDKGFVYQEDIERKIALFNKDTLQIKGFSNE